MALPALIAQNPQAALMVAQALAKLGSSFLGRNDAKEAIEKAEETNRQAMARANLRQSFGGNPSVERVQPKLDQGFGTTLLSKLGDAAGLASTAYGLYDAKKMADLQRQGLQGQIDARKLNEDITRGATLGAGSTLPKTDTIAPKLSAPVGGAAGGRAGRMDPSRFMPQQTPSIEPSLRVSPADITLGGSVAPGGLSDVGQAAFTAAQNERIAGMGATQSAAQQQAFENNIALSEKLLKTEDLSLKTQIFQDKLDNLGKLTTKDRLSVENTLRKDFNKLTGEFREVGNSFNTILAGADNPTAVSDMSLIFSFMKMLDPGSVVRESEFDQAESAAGWSDSALNAMNKFWDGTKLTTNRGDFLKQAKNLYDARLPGYTNIVDTYTAIAGRESLDARNIVMEYGVNLDRFDEILKKSQSPVGEGVSDLGGGVDMEALRKYKPGGQVGGNILSILGGGNLPGSGVLRREYQ